MKNIIIFIFALMLLITGCQMGADKIYYPTSNSSSSESTGSEATSTTSQTASKYNVYVDSNFDENAVPSALVSSKAAVSSAPAYNRDEVLVFDDPVLEAIIREYMYIPKASGDITIGDWVDCKFDSISIYFKLEDNLTIVSTVGYSYAKNKTVPGKTYKGLIQSFAVLSKLYGLKKVELSFNSVSPEFVGSFAIDLSPIFSAKQVETFRFLGINNLDLTIKGIDLISTNTQLKELKLTNCGLISLPSFKTLKSLSVVDVSSNKLNSGNQLLELNAAVIKQIKYSNNPTIPDSENLYNNLVKKFTKDKIIN